MQKLLLVGLGMLLVSSAGCAKLWRGDSQKLMFVTEPEGAIVKVGDQEYTTPAEVRLKRKGKHEVVISKAGYRTVKFDMAGQWDGMSLLSFLLPGGSLWFATDTATGADRSFYKLDTVELRPTTNPSDPPLELIYHRGKLYTEEEYKEALEEERKYREYYFEPY